MLSITRMSTLGQLGSGVSKCSVQFKYYWVVLRFFIRSTSSFFFAPPGGLVLFAVLSIIMDIFKLASYVGYLHCGSAVKVAFPVVQIVFTFVQVEMNNKMLLTTFNLVLMVAK